jgi:hypothetical protein
MIDEARTFIWLNGRVLDQRRFEFLFDSGSPDPVVQAVLAYRNPDGGFGHALEPDGRGPLSQPLHTYTALALLDEVGDHRHATSAVEYLQSVSAPDGGISVGVVAAADYPHAPWWDTDGQPSLLATALVVGLLHRMKLDHPWLDSATSFVWRELDGLQNTHPYEASAAARFLDCVPDRPRAETAARRLGELVRAARLVDLGEDDVTRPAGYAAGETHKPHDFAPAPDSLARRWFSDDEIDRSLDTLQAEQRIDGGWPFGWAAWTDVNRHDWGAVVTIEALLKLHAYGRLG